MIDTAEHAEEEASRAFWTEPTYVCLGCGEGTTGERDRCPKCEYTPLSHQLTDRAPLSDMAKFVMGVAHIHACFLRGKMEAIPEDLL